MKTLLKLNPFEKWQVTRQNRVPVFIVLGLFFISSYFLNNAYHIVKPTTLQLTPIDTWIPFWPWTVWIYITDYLYPFVVGMLLTTSRSLTRVCLAFFLMTFFTNLIFLLLPVYSLRELYPLAESESWLLFWIRKIDGPTNCFPSAHVSIVWLTWQAIRDEKPKLSLLFGVWCILIALSTLTTKQHYFVDVVGGAFLGHFCYKVAARIHIK